jgi:hypothetical protein
MKNKLLTNRSNWIIALISFFCLQASSQSTSNDIIANNESNYVAFNSANNPTYKNGIIDQDGHYHEKQGVAQNLGTTGACVPGTISRFTGSWHSNLYIGNNNGSNTLLAWGQLMSTYIGLSAGDILSPVTVSAASYSGVPLEVKSSSSGSGAGLSVLALRTSTKLYVFGTLANYTTLTSMSNFGGASLTAATSDVTSLLPVPLSQVAQMALSQTAFAIVTTTGDVYILTKVTVMQGDQAVAGTGIWHHVKLADNITYLTNVKKISVSSSGAFALTNDNKIYYWGAPANVSSTANTTISYNYAYDMSSKIPSGRIVTDVVCLGLKTTSRSTLFILCDNQKVYGCGLNTGGCLGINDATVTTNQINFATVKGTDGIADLANIVKIDGDTESDVYCIGAMSSDGKIYGWGDGPAGMLSVPASGASINPYAVPKTLQLFVSPAPATGFTDFSIAGHFTIAFYTNGTTDQYWYLGHNTGGSIGNGSATASFVVAAAPFALSAPAGISFDCSNAQPAITAVTASLTTFSACTGSASAAQSFTISGDNLSADIVITAPTGYELCTTLAGTYTSALNLTPVSSAIAVTTIYIRLSSSAANGATGNVSCTSTNAPSQNFTTGTATVSPFSVGGSISGSTTVTAGTNSTTLTLSGYTGAIIQWESSTFSDFSSGVTVIANTSNSYTATNILVTTYYRAIITSGSCTSANSGLATLTVGTLPLTWLSINALKKEQNILLSWSTASEQNTQYFLAQHSTNANSWNNIGRVPAAGNSLSVQHYSLLHTSPATGLNYYRLLQKDLDDNSSYSKIVSVLFTAPLKQLMVYSNKIEDGKLLLQLQKSAAIQLYNNMGVLVLRQQLTAGMQTIHVSHFAKGIYLLQSGSETEKIIIQ